VAISKADKAMEYASYAAHCLKLARKIPDHDLRIIQREMAAEWMKLAGQSATNDAAINRRTTRQSRMRITARS
jgi:hypothetical protein